ncbi:hypothetical protein BGZ61DRAFT_574819 [Ilyonectria robusta]|uniref:uncharacterized protein n=1 Tax=Ilyonectria robusta TaxID=1079257 RepID=UPI001E8DAB64|nr:uncharacterized protein BGZ61DRAFT_574819 [Ilyonectria robusta]KAH8714753.1 hypothetical protein BGZ61DRAFT_574819 [Ilyonectria robusta]
MGEHISSQPFNIKDEPVENQRPMRVIVIGAGFSGIYAAIRISQRLKNVQLQVYEQNEETAGVWWLNRYPGLACDIPSYSYQFSFAPSPYWSALYAPGPEIRAYMQDVAERYGATRYIKTSHAVKECVWDSEKRIWRVKVHNIETDEVFEDTANVVISAKGGLNEVKWPNIKGLGDYKGKLIHSGKWDESADLRNKRVGVIGNGSSAIQIVPAIQPLEGIKVWNFARSPTWVSNSFGDVAMAKLGREPGDNKYSPEQATAVGKFQDYMKKRLEGRPDLYEAIIPTFAPGCRRLTPGPGYLESLKEDNVVFCNKPIQQITKNGLTLSTGEEIELDVLVCATGYNVGAPPTFTVTGRNGVTLEQKWTPHPETYLSVAVDGFPNFLFIGGPNSSLGSGSLLSVYEGQGDYAVKMIRKLQKEDYSTFEVRPERVADFSHYIDEYFKRTVYTDDCSSWYRSHTTGSRIVALWPGSSAQCLEVLRAPRWEDYVLESADPTGNLLRWLGNGSSMTLKEGDPSWFLEPGAIDVPKEGKPEESEIYLQRPFSH